jgi:hypothetical protein
VSTINTKDIIDTLIANDGYYDEEDPRVYMIVEYTNAYGDIVWGVTWINEDPSRLERYLVPSQFVRNPKVIWKAQTQ